jgi:hypothetical protein
MASRLLTADGADIGASESLSHPRMLALALPCGGGGWSVVSRTPFSDRGVLQEEHRGYLITEFVS